VTDGDTQPDQAPQPSTSAVRAAWQIIKHTVTACVRYRATGLAAEAAFFTILSMPPLIFGLAGTVGFAVRQFKPSQIDRLRDEVINLSLHVLTPDVVNNVIKPTLNEVLSGGRFDVLSIGFVLALWSGSRALNVFIDAISVMHGLGGKRNFVLTRALSFVLYVLFLVVGVVLIPLVLAGPSLVDRLIPDQLNLLQVLYWPVVLLGSTILLATLYRLAVPMYIRLCSELPGAVLALMIWVGGSVVLRFFLDLSASSPTIYGPLTTPIALLIWLFLISIAVLIGAAFNAAARTYWPWSQANPARHYRPARRSPLLARLRGVSSSDDAERPTTQHAATEQPAQQPTTEQRAMQQPTTQQPAQQPTTPRMPNESGSDHAGDQKS
jgi:membrane protein